MPWSRGQAWGLRGGREGRGGRCAGTASPYSHIPLRFSSSRPCRRSTRDRGCRRSAYEKNRPLSASRRPAPAPAAAAGTPPGMPVPASCRSAGGAQPPSPRHRPWAAAARVDPSVCGRSHPRGRPLPQPPLPGARGPAGQHRRHRQSAALGRGPRGTTGDGPRAAARTSPRPSRTHSHHEAGDYPGDHGGTGRGSGLSSGGRRLLKGRFLQQAQLRPVCSHGRSRRGRGRGR